ncbi:hypothetical protein [Nocardia puris]|uniref:Uncharacterized protein n=1 Tax=Nocardia puris TaxID=208602 RepID=A0A366DQG5_9NOCA|nr:hypothetical protein [Nocardia puris]RBO91709.1 hypothetical protein DFR74_104416 [Nocardia puris]
MPVRPLTFREQLDLPFALIQADIKALAAAAGLALVLAELVVVGITGLGSHLTDGSDAGTAWAAILGTLGCAWLVRLFLRGVTVPLGLATVGGSPIGLRTAFERMTARFTPLLIAQLMFTLTGLAVLVGGGFLIVTLPFALVGLGYLRAKRFLVVPVIFAERADYGAAVQRTKVLVFEAEWSLTGLWLCQRMLYTLLTVPLLALPWFVSDFSGTRRWAVIALLTGAALLIAAFAEIVDSSSRVVSYVDRRCRREGLDIRVPEARR